ncbi:class I SAM-dependent RNA methyltransferase [soil metagenome]
MRRSKRKPSKLPPVCGKRLASSPQAGRAQPFEAQPFEAQVLDGLKPFAERELARLRNLSLGASADPEAVHFRYAGPWARLAELRTVVAVYLVERFDVPRPKALLGHQHLRRLLGRILELRAAAPFGSFRLSAAGRDTEVYSRLTAALGEGSGLAHDADEGDLLLRVRPTMSSGGGSGNGWEVLLRLTPRPLSARRERVCNLEGGLNATVAAAMLACAPARPGDRVLNLMCGSGTLLIERHAQTPAARLVGVDLNPKALDCARENLAAAGASAELLKGDATALPFAPGSFDLVLTDPPWGDQVGSHEANTELYPALLAEAARVAAPGATFVLLSHEIRLLERVLTGQRAWHLEASHRVYHGGHYPRLYVLRRGQGVWLSAN